MNAPLLSATSFGGRKVIDIDTHLTEPHDLWTRHASARLKDRVPQVKMQNGARSWVIDGDIVLMQNARPSSTIRLDGSKAHGLEHMKHQIETIHPASHSLTERLEMMDATGITAQIVYPNILGFGGQNAVKADEELRLASVQIFNDAMAEMQTQSGDRIFPMALLPWWDVGQAVKEVERASSMGLKGVNINSDPHNFVGRDGAHLPDLGRDHWNPLWETCEALDLPINFHIGASEASLDFMGSQGWPGLEPDLRAALGGAMLFINNGRVLGNLIFAGVPERFPRLKFVSVESGLGWIPFLLEALDYQYREVGADTRRLQRKPSEYFASNFYASFWFERDDLSQLIRKVGVGNVMFETDFPHPVCLYPIDDVDAAMRDLSEDEKVKILSGNASRVYKIAV
jgi:predicted TIM-barrel fold metal-dependent hydrolase